MKREVSKSLRIWFFIHFLVDYIFGLPLIIAPVWFLNLLGWQVIDPFASRLAGAALLGIGGVSLLERNNNLEVYKSLLNLKIIWSSAALIGIFISMIQEGIIFGWVVFVMFFVFWLIWVYYKIKL